MIQIRRPDEGPARLKRLGERQTLRDCGEYDLCPGDYQSGRASFPQRKYYSARAVKDLLVKMHHSKCCYCEQRFCSTNLEVEHFRPKSGVRQTLKQKKDERLGYYWLVYRWDNLLLSCRPCNLCKGTRFPLANPKERARAHNDDIGKERPLFVDPAGQDPRDHIRFDGDAPKGLTPEGRMTIDGIRLRRVGLREERLKKIVELDIRFKIMEIATARAEIPELHAMAKEARKFIKAAMRTNAEFSSMAIDYVARRGL